MGAHACYLIHALLLLLLISTVLDLPLSFLYTSIIADKEVPMKRPIAIAAIGLIICIVASATGPALPTCGLCTVNCGEDCTHQYYTDEFGWICGICPGGLDLVCWEVCSYQHCTGGGDCLQRTQVLDYCDLIYQCD